MLIFEIKKEKEDDVKALFKDCSDDFAIVETHRFCGSPELVQIAVMVTATTIGSILALVKEIKEASLDATIKGQGEEMDPEDVTEEFLKENRDDVE